MGNKASKRGAVHLYMIDTVEDTLAACGIKTSHKLKLTQEESKVTCRACLWRIAVTKIKNAFEGWCRTRGIKWESVKVLPRYKDRFPESMADNLEEWGPYFIYNCAEEAKLSYINKWYMDCSPDVLEIVVFKEVTEATANHLYNRKHNAIRIFPGDSRGTFKVHIDSVDDASYGMWHKKFTPEILVRILDWAHDNKIIDGEDMFKLGREMGFTDFDYD